MGSHVLDAVRNPVDVLFGTDDHVGQHRRAARPGHGEKVREPVHIEPEVGHRPGLPRLGQGLAVAAANVDPQQRTGHGIEPGGEDQHVELVVVLTAANAGLSDRGDRRSLAADVHQRHVRAVVGVVVVGVNHQALATNEPVRGELARRLAVLDGLGNLLPHEVRHELVGFRTAHRVTEAGQEHRPAAFPQQLHLGTEIRRIGLQRKLHGPLLARPVPAEHALVLSDQFRVHGLDLGLLRRVERTVASGDGELRGALEHRELCRGLRHHRDGLDA